MSELFLCLVYVAGMVTIVPDAFGWDFIEFESFSWIIGFGQRYEIWAFNSASE